MRQRAGRVLGREELVGVVEEGRGLDEATIHRP